MHPHGVHPTAPLAPELPAVHGGTLQLVTAARTIALDPAFASEPGSQRIAFVTCETLLTYADQPGEGGRTLLHKTRRGVGHRLTVQRNAGS